MIFLSGPDGEAPEMNDLNYFGPSTNFSAEFVFKLQYLGIQIRSSQLHYLLSLFI